MDDRLGDLAKASTNFGMLYQHQPLLADELVTRTGLRVAEGRRVDGLKALTGTGAHSAGRFAGHGAEVESWPSERRPRIVPGLTATPEPGGGGNLADDQWWLGCIRDAVVMARHRTAALSIEPVYKARQEAGS
ncbi:hypothetical protein [Streptomyces atroolivaceus]|uniref:hypothetical protein n=1 Tax=Streptomyces atroolivaceus TaxID=66869 RepID=UPI002024204C|nr:hypothetical protein [Streptomyces atroolivaceus]